MWWRIGLIGWISCGALALGALTFAANKKGVRIPPSTFLLGFLLGPIFLFFVLPWQIGRWKN